MRRLICIFGFGMVMAAAIPGCGDSGPQSAYEGSSEQEVADFKAQYAKDQARQQAEADAMGGQKAKATE